MPAVLLCFFPNDFDVLWLRLWWRACKAGTDHDSYRKIGLQDIADSESASAKALEESTAPVPAAIVVPIKSVG